MTGISDESRSSSIIQKKGIKIVVESMISSIALLAYGQQFVSGDKNGKIRRWQMEDGEEVGAPINAESSVRCIATSQDGKRIVAGTETTGVSVWDVQSREKLTEFVRAQKGVNSVDISSDGTKILIAWDDKIIDIYSLPDGKKLYGRKNCDFLLVKFSPDGLFVCGVKRSKSSSLEVIDIQNADLLCNIRISARSVAWTSDSKQLFTLSFDGNILCVEASGGKTLSKWSIPGNDSPTCISLSSNGAFIAASASSSVSFWDTSTQEQIGSIIHHLGSVSSMAISQNYDLVIAGNSTISLWDLLNVLSTPGNQVGGF